MKAHLKHLILLMIMTIMFAFQSIAFGEDIYSDVKNSAGRLADVLVIEYGVSGVQYALISDGKIVLSGTSGVFNKDQTRTLDNQSLFGIGSTSKIFPTTAVMILSDQGKINLDEPVTTYIPEFKMADPRYKEITVRMLLNHSSGIMGSNYHNTCLYDYPSTYAHDNLLPQLAEEQLKADPGDFSVYCNDGFTLAEIVVERVSGMSFSEFIRKNITGPLGMNNTYTPLDDFDRNRLVRTYVNGKETPVEHPHSQFYHDLESTYREIVTNKELPGYAGPFKIVDEYKAIQDVQIPVMASRDLVNIEIFSTDGKEYLESNDLIYICEKDMVDLYAGKNAICTIQEDGYARWYTVNQKDAGKTMIVDLPENGSFAVYNEESCIYFSVVDGNQPVVLPENGKLVFIGESPGDRFTITTDFAENLGAGLNRGEK